jgi:hypothetical protein
MRILAWFDSKRGYHFMMTLLCILLGVSLWLLVGFLCILSVAKIGSVIDKTDVRVSIGELCFSILGPIALITALIVFLNDYRDAEIFTVKFKKK